jgi:4-amino-4-deoxy-L-arabinose transferase-like glycosyltransferase
VTSDAVTAAPGAAISPRSLFFALLPLTLAFRFWLAAVTPFTGDEAYFYWWGKIPDWGYYDHPPMIGWLHAALIPFGEAEWWLRLPQVLQPAILASAVAWALGRTTAAWWAALLTLLSPAFVWNVFITTDTPLVYFSLFSALAFLRAARDDDWRYYLLAGVLLAGAVLSKYFAALLGFAYLVFVLVRPNRRKWLGLLLAYAPVLPALVLMAWWNAGHCWPNYMFNFVNRHEDAGLSWRTPLLYAVTLLYLLTPPLLWLLARHRAALRSAWEDAPQRAAALLAAVPLTLFAGLSLVKQIGLHWLLAFVPLALILLVGVVPEATTRRLAKFFAGFAVLHVIVAVMVAVLPLETWKRTKLYEGVVLTVASKQLLQQLKPYENDYVFASDGYSNAVTLGYDARRYFIVFGTASSHARHDDILTDFRALAGRNILILRKSEPANGEYARYFREVDVKTFRVRGATFYRVLGRGFDYPAYRDTVLAEVRRKYYALPAFLPQSACYFCDRYFEGTQCSK